MHSVERGAGHRRQVEIGCELLSAGVHGRVQNGRGGGVAGIGAAPQPLGGLGAELVVEFVGGRIEAARVGPRHRALEIASAGLLQAPPDPGQGGGGEDRGMQPGRGRAAEGSQGPEDGVAGAAVERLDGHHAVDHPHGRMAVRSGGQGGLEIAHRAVGRGGQKGPHGCELALRQVAHEDAATPVDFATYIAEAELRLCEAKQSRRLRPAAARWRPSARRARTGPALCDRHRRAPVRRRWRDRGPIRGRSRPGGRHA